MGSSCLDCACRPVCRIWDTLCHAILESGKLADAWDDETAATIRKGIATSIATNCKHFARAKPEGSGHDKQG